MTNESAWNVTPHSDSRMNRMTNIPNTGTVLAALDKTKHGLFICTADGSGLLKDHVYFCNADGNALIDLSAMAEHNHSDISTDGGEFNALFRNNPKHADLWLTKSIDLYESSWASPVYWTKTVTGTGSVENKTDGTTNERSIRLRPNATSGSGSTIQYPYLGVDWTQNLFFQAKLQIETATSIALHSGVRCDFVTSADGNARKLQAEVCTVTNNNWWLRTANGTANSASDTGIAITANRTGIRMKNFPQDPSAQLTVGTGTTLEKTSNIAAIAGAPSDSNVIMHSVKNSTGADRPLLVYGSRLVYYVEDSWI